MLADLIAYPDMKEKKNISFVDARNKNSNPYFSSHFEIQELDFQETYNSQSQTLTHNDLNSFVVDWEIPKMGH